MNSAQACPFSGRDCRFSTKSAPRICPLAAFAPPPSIAGGRKAATLFARTVAGGAPELPAEILRIAEARFDGHGLGRKACHGQQVPGKLHPPAEYVAKHGHAKPG